MAAFASLPPTFDGLFSGQALVAAGMFAFSFEALSGVPAPARRGGFTLMRFALAGLSLLFLSYVPLYAISSAIGVAFLVYAPIADLLLETLLGFGMVLLLADDAGRATEAALAELEAARRELERQARIDPLTEVFNRHAFHSLVGQAEASPAHPLTGVVAMIDVDGLKDVNDREGHAAGDAALRHAASAIRKAIRPEDLLFRWGGDEFLLLLPGVDPAAARSRLGFLEEEGVGFTAPGGRQLRVSLSVGLRPFASTAELGGALSAADRDMYARKSSRHVQR